MNEYVELSLLRGGQFSAWTGIPRHHRRNEYGVCSERGSNSYVEVEGHGSANGGWIFSGPLSSRRSTTILTGLRGFGVRRVGGAAKGEFTAERVGKTRSREQEEDDANDYLP